MTKIVKILVLVAILTVTLAVSPAQACACHVPDWSVMSAGPASADERSDSELRHRINEIQNNPGPVTNQERNKIQDLRSQIDDNDDNDDDDDDNDDDNDDVDDTGLDDELATDDLDEDDDEVDEIEVDDEDEDEDEVEASTDDDESDEASLEVLLDQRAAKHVGTGDEDEDIMEFGPRRERVPATLRTSVAPLRDRQEFVCTNCYLVKPRVQLADPERMRCRDCV